MKPTIKAALAVLALACTSAWGQDPGIMAAQQATQQANQQAMNAMMMANNAAQWNSTGWNPALFAGSRVLSLSVGPGNVKPGTKLRIDLSPDRNAQIYYTTDGWTPTTASTRYTGPIKIDSSMNLQAIAVGSGLPHALLIRANYTVNGVAPQAAQEAALTINGVLAAGTPIRLATGSVINSETAHAGDNAAILLDEDLKVGDTVVAAKGTPVEAVLTRVVPSKAGASGQLAFEIRSLTVRGQTISLTGTEALEGGVAKDAVIKPGMALTAKVAKETTLRP